MIVGTRTKWSVIASAVVLSFSAATVQAIVSFDWATVDQDLGNANDIHGDGYGSVDYAYRISKHEVTNAQYAEFLNDKSGRLTIDVTPPKSAKEMFSGLGPKRVSTRFAKFYTLRNSNQLNYQLLCLAASGCLQ